jgi:hypothetical protein
MSTSQKSVVDYFSQVMQQATQTQCTMPSRCMNEAEYDNFRTFYLETMGLWKDSSREEVRRQRWAQVRARFQTITDEVMKNVAASGAANSQTRSSVVLRVDGRNYPLSTDCITIGRVPMNDIVLDETKAMTSRLHAIVLRFGRCLAIVDVGSFCGIECCERSKKGAPLETSSGSDRRPLIVEDDETAVFRLGPSILTVNPKECVIMGPQCTGTRNFYGQCGHFICCVACARDWSAGMRDESVPCPICRQPFFGVDAAFDAEHVHTALQ